MYFVHVVGGKLHILPTYMFAVKGSTTLHLYSGNVPFNSMQHPNSIYPLPFIN